jgi:hypothetical protein
MKVAYFQALSVLLDYGNFKCEQVKTFKWEGKQCLVLSPLSSAACQKVHAAK